MGLVTDPRTGQTTDIAGIDQATLDDYIARNGNLPGDRSVAEVFQKTASEDGGRGGDADTDYNGALDTGWINVPIAGLGRHVLQTTDAAAYLATAASSNDPTGPQYTADQFQPLIDAISGGLVLTTTPATAVGSHQIMTATQPGGSGTYQSYSNSGSTAPGSAGSIAAAAAGQPLSTIAQQLPPSAGSSPAALIAIGAVLLKMLGVL